MSINSIFMTRDLQWCLIGSPKENRTPAPDVRVHTNTQMTEKHYGHLAPTALADAIRTLTTKLGLGNAPKVAPLKMASASE